MTREAAARLRAGHPWIFRDALVEKGVFPESPGQIVTVQDVNGEHVGRGFWESDGAVAIRLLTWDPRVYPNADLYSQLLDQALALRQDFLEEGVEAYRIINGEGDGLPGFTVDRYGDYLVAQLFTLAAEPLTEAIYPLLLDRTGARGLYEQRRLRPGAEGRREPAALRLGEAAPPELALAEYGCRFVVDVTAPRGIGWFPDLREARRWVSEHAAGRRVLNTFSYTGGFTVHALRGGAEQVVAVDLSAKAHGWSRKNLRQNGLEPEDRCRHLTADVIAALARLQRDGERFELAILDPPGFSRGPRGPLATGRDYAQLVSQILPLVIPGGLLLAVSNMARLPDDEFARVVGRGGLLAGRPLRLVRTFPLPPDFPVPPAFLEGRYLKAYLIRA